MFAMRKKKGRTSAIEDPVETKSRELYDGGGMEPTTVGVDAEIIRAASYTSSEEIQSQCQ